MLNHALSVLFIAGAAAAADSLSFLAIGDWGGTNASVPTSPGEVNNNIGMGKVAGELGDVGFVLAMGDNFYEDGLWGSEYSKRFQETFEDVFTSEGLQVPWYVVAGNHDYLGNVTAQIEYTRHSTRWNFPSHYYSFTKNLTTSSNKTIVTEIIYLDTVVLTGMSHHDEATGVTTHPEGPADVKLAETQYKWLEDTMAKSTADYLWVAGHYPVYSQCVHGPTFILVEQVLPLLKKYKASGYASGHDHCQGYFQQDGLSFVLSGAGKECCYSPKHADSLPANITKFHMDGHNKYDADGGFAAFTVNETMTIVRYFTDNGTLIYTTDPIYPRAHQE
eukprot:TRINITY_DN46707_c0_g1_i1.p1 TRINITY_DN46707_c0_g1~~TRINITY_DN46707_c0_g1_i1.p1  ORF type:complete len:348 (+),score=74.47 TRINITY_DN46707_c0_g1_i1:47-1045(+)